MKNLITMPDGKKEKPEMFNRKHVERLNNKKNTYYNNLMYSHLVFDTSKLSFAKPDLLCEVNLDYTFSFNCPHCQHEISGNVKDFNERLFKCEECIYDVHFLIDESFSNIYRVYP